MKNIQQFSFTSWLASANAVSFSLFIGVLFLFVNYAGVINLANPGSTEYKYYPIVLFLLAHIDAFFFATVTGILLFQGKREGQKIFYCCLEGILVFLSFNRNHLTAYLDINSQFLIGTYIAVFSGISFYFLGSLAKEHQKNKNQGHSNTRQAEPQQSESEASSSRAEAFTVSPPLPEPVASGVTAKKPQKIKITGFKNYDNLPENREKVPKNYKKAIKFIKNGATIDEICAGAGISKVTAIKCKKYYQKHTS